MLVLGSFSRPGHSFVRAGRVHDMLLLEVRMRTTRGHILQEGVMHVIDVILKKHLPKGKLLKKVFKKREKTAVTRGLVPLLPTPFSLLSLPDVLQSK